MILVNHYVIIQKYGGEHSRITKVSPDQNILIEKLRFNINGAINKPYGLYEVLNGKLLPCLPSVEEYVDGSVDIVDYEVSVKSDYIEDDGPSSSKKLRINELEEGKHDETSSSNLKINDDIKQALTCDEIQSLKHSGVTTSILVSKLVDGNKYFTNRTEYSQVKYVEKKTKKHSDRVLILKPTLRLLNECYYKRGPERIANMRY